MFIFICLEHRGKNWGGGEDGPRRSHWASAKTVPVESHGRICSEISETQPFLDAVKAQTSLTLIPPRPSYHRASIKKGPKNAFKKQNKKAPEESEALKIKSIACDSGAIRTLDPQLRRLLLYPAELRNLTEIRQISKRTAKLEVFRHFSKR